MLPSVLFGNKTRKINQAGYESFSATTLEFKTTSECTLDGEVVTPPENTPLRLSLGPKFKFLKV